MAAQAPRSFISFDFDNNENEKLLFAGQAKLSKTPFDLGDWSSKSALPQAQWEKLINEKIAKCHLMIVLVGKQSHMATGVAKEISMATHNNVPYFGVYVGGADTTTPLPSALARNRTIAWTWDGIAGAINQMLTEGKHSVKK